LTVGARSLPQADALEIDSGVPTRQVIEDAILLVATVVLAAGFSTADQWRSPAAVAALFAWAITHVARDSNVAGLRYHLGHVPWFIAAAYCGPAPGVAVAGLNMLLLRRGLSFRLWLNNVTMAVASTGAVGFVLLFLTDLGSVEVGSGPYLVAIIGASGVATAINWIVTLRAKVEHPEDALIAILRRTLPPVVAWEVLACVLVAALSATVFELGLIGIAIAAVATFAADRVLNRGFEGDIRERENSALRQEAERARTAARTELAGSLHDDALQLLLAARQDVIEAMAGDAPRLERASERLSDTVQKLRALLAHLQQGDEESASIAVRLEEIVCSARESCSAQISWEIDRASADLVDDLLAQSARELLINAVRHADASYIEIRISREADRMQLCVWDDGRGISDEALAGAGAAGHVGVLLVRSRVHDAGGSFSLRPAAPRGTEAIIDLPVPSRRST
jgi:signal transduction histidine kinase